MGSLRIAFWLWVVLVLLLSPVWAVSASASNQPGLAPDLPTLVQGNGKGGGNSNKGGNSGGNGNGNGGGNSGGSSGKNSDNPGPNPNSNANPNPSSARQPRSYMGQVTVSAGGQVIAGNVRIQSNSPWLSLAIPGMWLEANGVWEGEVFVATEVKLYSPVPWAFYQGPGSLVGASQYPVVSAWLSNNRSDPFMALQAASEQAQVRVVAYFDGSKFRALPASFPVPAGLKPGWYELMGSIGAQGLVWSSVRPFP